MRAPTFSPRTPNRGIALVYALLSISFLLAQASGDVNPGGEPQYIHRVWQAEDGLRSPVTRTITQSEDGYLWLATEEGLVRFDGARFTEFETKTVRETLSRWIVALIQTRDGSIWTSSSNGGLSRLKDGVLTRYTTADGLPTDVVLSLFEDSRGRLWIGSTGGLTRFENGAFHTYAPVDGWINQSVRCITEDREGNLWLGTPDGLNRMKDGKFTLYTKDDMLRDNSVMALHVDQDDHLWVGTAEGLTHLKKDGTFRHYTVNDGLAHDVIRAIHQDRQGVIWIGSHGGLQQIREGQIVRVTFRGWLSSALTSSIPDFVYSIYEDREGTLWVGTNVGLNQINVQKFSVYSEDEGLPNDLTTAIYEDREGSIWVSTWGGGLTRLRNGEMTTWTTSDGLASDHILGLHQDREGNLWIGTDGSGIHRFADEEFAHYLLEGDRPENTIRVIFEDSRGRLWAGGNAGLTLFRDGAFQSSEALLGLKLDTVKVITEDARGVVWIGSADGLTRIEGETLRTFTAADGLSSTMVQMIYPDAGGVLWVATEGGGLNRFRPGEPVIVYSSTSGLFRERILHLLEDDAGFFWMSSGNGVFRVSKKELNDFALGLISFVSPISYGKSDGMRRAQCNGIAQPAGWKSRDRRLWFPTMSGAVVFDPTETRINEVPPPVVIERVLVDGEEVPLKENIRIPPGQGRLEVEFTALSFQVPEKVRFKFMLEGFDSEWQEGGTRRSAIYHNLPPGDFRFRVAASNNDGVWNSEGADFTFFLAPHFYQTYWFFALCALVLVSSGAGIYGLRVRQMHRRHQELSQLVEERTRKLQEEIRERRAAQRRTAAFSRLGQQLSLTSTPVEAGNIIVKIADELIGWDSCGVHAYSAEKDSKTPIIHYDLVDGRRVPVAQDEFDPEVGVMMRRTIDKGAQLVLRKEAAIDPGFIPYGDTSRASASLMYAPIRNGTKVVGLLAIQSYSFNAYDRRDLETLQALADYCGGAFERLRTEEALHESQNVMLHQERLAAIGQLSSGAAHEFNNILTIIQGHSSLLLSEGGLNEEMVESLREISGSADRAANLTRQLLTFSRKQFMRPQVLDLNLIIGEVASMLSRLLGEHIVFDCKFANHIPPIRADRGMIEQIIMNLAVNARDAMAEKGGKLTVATELVEITPQHPHPEARAGKFVALSVSDTGCGMSSDVMDRIFEPFFTTKGIGEGTGLGLSSVYGIVKQHRGWIEVSSKVGQGARFNVYLPVTTEVIPEPAQAETNLLAPVPGKEETILVVEDEEGLRKMVCSVLSKKSYRVLEASDGNEALKVWEEEEGRIDLLLTDMLLPGGISGRDVAMRLREKDPGLAVVFTSGYSQEILGDGQNVDESITFLPKPYPPESLAKIIRARLDAD